MPKYFNDCIDCKDRKMGCHATCEKYLADKKKHLKEKEKISASRRANNEYLSYRHYTHDLACRRGYDK